MYGQNVPSWLVADMEVVKKKKKKLQKEVEFNCDVLKMVASRCYVLDHVLGDIIVIWSA